jgi:ligand-binding sensor domain-containing protein/class 3 adenylate cyclase
VYIVVEFNLQIHEKNDIYFISRIPFYKFIFSNSIRLSFRVSAMKHIRFLLFVILFSHGTIYSQTELRYEHYNITHGLSSNYIKAIDQDANGLLWIGTIDGLNCFNGYDFVTYYNNENDSASLSDNSINDLLIDKKGVLWIGTNKGLNKYNRSTNRFVRFFSGLSENNNDAQALCINSITEDLSGNLWLGTDKGIRVLNSNTGTFRIPEIANDSVRIFAEAGLAAIFFDSNGITWLGSSVDKGFRIVDKNFIPVSRPEIHSTDPIEFAAVTGFLQDRNGIIWICTSAGLYSYEKKLNLFSRYTRSDLPDDPQTYIATSVIQDRDGQLWTSLAGSPPFYTSIAKINASAGTFRIYPYVENDDRGLAWNWNTLIFQDNNGIYWIGTSRGLDKMDPLCQQFKLYQQSPNLKYSRFNNIYNIAKDHNTIWLGTDGNGLIRYDIITKKFKDIPIPSMPEGSAVYSMLLQPNGNLLLGSQNGLFFYNTLTTESKLLFENPLPHGSGTGVPSCIINGDVNEVLIGYYGAGVLQYNFKTKKQKRYNHIEGESASLNSDQVNVIFRDSKGTYWIGFSDGISFFGGTYGKGLDRFNAADETFIHYSRRDNDATSLSSDNVICIAEDKQGLLWVGTRNGGLNRFEPATGKFKRYTMKEGMPSNFITAIQVDDSNRIWVSTFTNGIARLDPVTDEIRSFDMSQGLQNFRFNRQSTFKSEDGEIYFGGVSGFNSFHPSKLRFNSFPPKVLITGIKINNALYHPDTSASDIHQLKLTYDQSELQFSFAALNYSQTLKNQYAYMLEGYDKDWISAGTIRSVKYTNLDPGNYLFRVKASNNDNVWNDSGTSISIIISPPWWKEWWAYTAYFIIVISGIWIYIKGREKSLKAQQKKLERTVTERTTELVAEKKEAEKQKRRSDELLLNILPPEVAEELKQKGSAEAKQFDDVTVMFTDFKNFTKISEKLSPSELVAEIDYCFKAFDNIITKHNIEKIKTIGDSYMCAGGLPVINKTNAHDVVTAAIEIREFMQSHSQLRKNENKDPFEIRIGVHTGPVVAGIVGVKKFAYDIWGDTVNIASRMESSGEVGKINISGSTYALVKDKFTCIHRGKIQAKNKGEVDMYFV